MQNKNAADFLLNSRALPIALVGFATLLGGFVRFAAPLDSDFPLNDGRLFYAMIQSLQASGYSLPAHFEFNGALFPFAYPPLGFYVAGFASDLLRQPLLNVVRWFPALVSAATVPAFYFLACGFLPSKTTSACATLAFAILPRGFDWLIMGGGITRAFGLLFGILTLACAQRLFTAPQPRLIFWTSGWAALAALSHPESALQAAFALLLLLFFNRSRANLAYALLAAALALLLTSPW